MQRRRACHTLVPAHRRHGYSPGVELAATTTARYVEHAFQQMLVIAERLGDAKVGVRPVGPRTNTVAALIVHCCGMAEYWIGHVALGRPSSRDRDAELTATAMVSELQVLVERSLETILSDLSRLVTGEARQGHEARVHLVGGASDDSLVLHVLEELFQHLGHMELTADALLA
jgi:hypothetical protein